MNSDDIFKLNISEMYALHKKERALITISLVRLKDATGKGVVKLKGNRIIDFAARPRNPKNQTINSGVYMLNKRVIDVMPKEPSFSVEKDFYQNVVKKYKVCGYISKLDWCSIDTPETYKKVQNGLRNMNVKG